MGSLTAILQSGNTTRIAKANYRAQVADTANTNKLEGAKVGFAGFMRGLNNKAKLDAASREYNYQVGALDEELRGASTQSINSSLQLATAQGALRAQAGAVGVGGNTVDLMDTLTRLQTDANNEQQNNAINLMASKGAKSTASIISGALGNLDMTRTFGQFDYRSYIQPKDLKHKALTLVGIAAATYFGGPQAGEAAADGAMGEWQARNGNFTGAMQSYGGAVTNTTAALKSSAQRGGQSWASSAFNFNDGTGGSTADVTSQGSGMYSLGGDTSYLNDSSGFGGGDSGGFSWSW
jgi:hypothetical protein